MKRFLSIVLSVMMILSSVSFAVPNAVNAFDTSYEMTTTQESTASLSYDGSWTDTTKGDLLYAVTFDDIASVPGSFIEGNSNGVGNTLVSEVGAINSTYAESLTDTTIGCRDGSAMSVVTETDGNKYLNMTVNQLASIITYDFYVGAGTYTFEYDYIADGTDGVYMHSTTNYANANSATPVHTINGTWQHFSITFDADDSTKGTVLRSRLNSSTVDMGIDNIKVYYKDPNAVVTPPEQATGATVTLFEVNGENLKDGYSLSGFGSSDGTASNATLVTNIVDVNADYAASLTAAKLGCRTASSVSVETETSGNKFIRLVTNARASLITRGFYVDAGKYTFEYDFKADGTSVPAIHTPDALKAFTPEITELSNGWKHFKFEFDVTSDPGYIRTYLSATTVNFDVDNIKMSYFDPEAAAEPPVQTGATVTLYEVNGENMKDGYSLSGFGSSDGTASNATLVTDMVDVNADYAASLTAAKLGCRTASSVSVETETSGNKFIRLVTNARASLITRGFYVDAGKYTFEYDFKADGSSVPYVHSPTDLQAFTPEITELSNGWKHFKLEFDITSDCSYVRTYLNASTVNFDVDNIKMSYYDPDAIVETEPKPETYTVTLDANGNGAVQNVTVSDVEAGTVMAVSDLVARIDTSSTTDVLLGISETADGEVLSGNVTIDADKTYYMIWKEVYVLPAINWMDTSKGYLLYTARFDDMKADADLSAIGSANSDGTLTTNISETATINPKYVSSLENTLLGFRTITSAAVAAKDNGDKYLNVVAGERPSLITRDFYMGEGTYTFEYDYQTNNETGVSINSPTAVKAFTPVISDAVDGWRHFSITFDTTSDVGFVRTISDASVDYFNIDNVCLYYKPSSVNLTLSANDNTEVQDVVTAVSFGQTYTVSELMALVDTTATTMLLTGISRTATGAAMSTAQTITIYEDTTLYLKWRAPIVSDGPIKNVIFMIPDGAGYGSYDFANDVKNRGGVSTSTGTNPESSDMTLRDYHVGSSNSLNFLGGMTDSGAGGTALSSGQKTRNLFLGLSKNNKPIASVLEAAQVQGKSTGIVSTYEWTHATPGSFTAHALDRSDYNDFYRQIENKGLNVVLGTGYEFPSKYLVDNLATASIQNAVDNGYTIVENKADLDAVQPGTKIWGNMQGLEEGHFPFDIHLKDGQPTLAEMTDAAIRAVSNNENGFLLMIEGSRVDTAAHGSMLLEMAGEYIAFDDAFKVAVEYAKTRTDTLVIAVPDHDTGGLYYDRLVNNGTLQTAINDTVAGIESSVDEWESSDHTLQDVPVWIYAPEGIELPEGLAAPSKDYYGNPKRTENVVMNADLGLWVAEQMGADLDALTEELFVDVTDIGTYDAATEKFTFNNGDKYAFKDEKVYYLGGEKTDMIGEMIVINGTVYVPAEIIDEDDWNYVNSANDGITGTGTVADPYVIDNAWDFIEFTDNMKNGNTYAGKYIVMNADIDLSNKASVYSGALSDVTFAGNFDGKGHVLTLNINVSEGNAVIFGVNTGKIYNIGVVGTLSTTGGYASFVRKNEGTIANCFSVANVSGSSNGNGFVISNYGTINNCYFGGTANGYAISGSTSTYVNTYYVAGSGLDTTATGLTSVSAETAKTTLAETLNGGLNNAATAVGFTNGADLNSWIYIADTDYPVLMVKVPTVTGLTINTPTLTAAPGDAHQYSVTVHGEYNPSKAVYYEITPSPSSVDTKIHDDGFLVIGKDETLSSFTVIAKSVADGSKTATSVVTVSGEANLTEDGTRAHPYLIENEEDFYQFSKKMEAGSLATYKWWKQTADIDMAGYKDYNGIPTSSKFVGVYDGNGYTININIVDEDGTAAVHSRHLFGQVENSVIMNLGVTGTLKGYEWMGGIARNANRTVFANIWTNMTMSSVYKDCASITRSPYNCVLVNCYANAKMISSVGGDHNIGPINGYTVGYNNNYYMGSTYALGRGVSEVSEVEANDGTLVGLLNGGKATSAQYIIDNAPNSHYTYMNSMLLPWITTNNGPAFRLRDDSKKLSETKTDKAYESLSVITNATVDAEDAVVTIENLNIGDGTVVTLVSGSFVVGNLSGNGTIEAAENVNIIVTGDNKPTGYVQINLGQRMASDNVRFAEINGKQFEISEYNDLYGLITDKDLLVEISEKTGANSNTSTSSNYLASSKYFYVDAETQSVNEITSLANFMDNYNGLSVRMPNANTENKVGLRFKTYVNPIVKQEVSEYEITEYGYVLGRASVEELTLDTVNKVAGVAYSKADGTDKIFDSTDDTKHIVAGVLYGIPETAYNKAVDAKMYVKINIDGQEYIVYSEKVRFSALSVAKRLQNQEMADEMKAIVDDIIQKGEGNDDNIYLDFGDFYS